MNNNPAVLWQEWFDKEREADFREATENIWKLLLRNGIASTVFKKWLRELVCSEIDLNKENDSDRLNIISNNKETFRRTI